MTEELLTSGNAAKLHALRRIDRLAADGKPLFLLDLGSGASRNFAPLLKKRANIRYLGVEPHPGACAEAREVLKGLNAEVRNAPAYDVRTEPADVVVSFSVLEHVYRRREYLACARRNLAPGGLFLINYDAGHFVSPGSWWGWTDRWKNLLGPLLARLGVERWYQSFVREADFRRMAEEAGFRVEESASFNTSLKDIYKRVPGPGKAAFMEEWLAWELKLNEMGIPYEDGMARLFGTRHFALRPA